MDNIGLHQLIEYCDSCAEKHEYAVEQKKPKGVCKLCGRIGRINQVPQNTVVDFEGFNEVKWEGGGFTVDQLVPFPTGQIRETVHPTLAYKLLNKKCVLYFDKDIVIIANPDTGQQIRIRF